ncbi:hypothetical protein C8R44DRAFT_876174 [Mycena epipterygia]|nr:hypothetical protein C8R44DRAFT_876174 [Mycena epipterygia]
MDPTLGFTIGLAQFLEGIAILQEELDMVPKEEAARLIEEYERHRAVLNSKHPGQLSRDLNEPGPSLSGVRGLDNKDQDLYRKLMEISALAMGHTKDSEPGEVDLATTIVNSTIQDFFTMVAATEARTNASEHLNHETGEEAEIAESIPSEHPNHETVEEAEIAEEMALQTVLTPARSDRSTQFANVEMDMTNQAIRWCKYGLSDPHKPPICAMGSLYAAHTVCAPQAGKAGVTDTDIVWPSVLSFLTAKRTPEQMNQLQTNMNTCNCPVNQESALTHAHGARVLAKGCEGLFSGGIIGIDPTANMTPYHCLMIDLFTGLSRHLTSLGVTRTAKGGADKWPKAPSDLLPHGVAITIQSLEQWLETLRDPAPFPLLLLTQLVRLCRTLIIPSMVASPKISHLVVAAMRDACDQAKSNMLTPPSPSPIFPRAKMSAAETLKLRISPVELFLNNFSPSTMKNALTAAEIYGFWGTSDRTFFECANNVLQLYISSPLFPPQVGADPKQFWAQGGSTILVFRSVVASMFTHINNKYGIPPDSLDADTRAMWESWTQRDADPRENIRRRLIWVKSEERCGVAGCTASLQTTSAKSHFQRCAGCGIVGWCSKDHQRLAWKDARSPHRDICKVIARFVAAAGGDLEDDAKFTHGAAKMPLDDLRTISEWLGAFKALQSNMHEGRDMFKMLHTHSNRNMCFAAGCARAKIHPASKKFNACGECGIFRYCNGECQKRGWKDPAAPHKEVCPVIKRAIAAGGGDVGDELTTGRRTGEGHVSADDAVLITTWFARFNREHSQRSPLAPRDKINL